ncbi:MAG: hypothetical protein ABGY95_06405 [Rubritalea sp.]|uniref:hypothetical protein n=1 Tax=Rubritalea sp. TaxID=2109375 RepID=UPI00324216E3
MQPPIGRNNETVQRYAEIGQTLAEQVMAERELLSQVVEASLARTVAFGHYDVSLEIHGGPVRHRCCAEIEAWQYAKRSLLQPLPGL